MSKLSDHLKAVQGYEKTVLVPMPKHIAAAQKITQLPFDGAYEYLLSATFSAKIIVSDKETLQFPLSIAKQHILEEVFGEFIPLVIDIERSLYAYDVESAKIATRKLLEALKS